MKNLAGLLVVFAGAFFVVVGLRGTQHAVFPGLFPVAGSSSSSSGGSGGVQLGPMPGGSSSASGNNNSGTTPTNAI